MTPELLHHPDPAQLSSITSTAEILAAVRQCFSARPLARASDDE